MNDDDLPTSLQKTARSYRINQEHVDPILLEKTLRNLLGDKKRERPKFLEMLPY